MPNFTQVNRETLGTAVYQQIRDAILDGDFFPGDPVKIRSIAEQMGVSATPVRDALLQLVMERVLIMPSSREIRVPLISQSDFQEIRTLRIMLEGHAAELAAVTATPKDIKRLEDINSKISSAFAAGHTKQALRQNRAFHASLYQIPTLPILEDVLDRLWLRMAPLIAGWSETARQDDFTAHHFDVIDALKARDSSAAKIAIVNDIDLGGEKIERLHLAKSWTSP